MTALTQAEREDQRHIERCFDAAAKRAAERTAELIGRDTGPKSVKKIDRREFASEAGAREFARDALRAGYLISREQFGATTIVRVFQLVGA